MGLDQTVVLSRLLHRRRFLIGSAALGASVLLQGTARSASVREVEGSVKVNGKPATRATAVRPGDLVETGPNAKLVFVVGQDAFLLREHSSLRLDRPTSSGKVASVNLRLENGALLAVFGKGRRLIETATATAGIRGTGVYLEASAEQTYFCTCYGAVELRDKAGRERKLVVAGHHTPTMIYAQRADGQLLATAAVKDHTDAELIMLDALVGRTSPMVAWQQRKEKATEAPQPEATQRGASEPAPEKPRRARSKPQQPAKPQPPGTASESQAPAPQPSALTAAPAPEAPVPSSPQAPPPEQELRLPPARLND
jgi:hypothetical protein